jgi:hypothetical protein
MRGSCIAQSANARRQSTRARAEPESTSPGQMGHARFSPQAGSPTTGLRRWGGRKTASHTLRQATVTLVPL